MKKHTGVISMILFVFYMVFNNLIQPAISANIESPVFPFVSIVLDVLITAVGVYFGYQGVKNKTQKTASLIGLILNSLALFSFLWGVLRAFT